MSCGLYSWLEATKKITNSHGGGKKNFISIKLLKALNVLPRPPLFSFVLLIAPFRRVRLVYLAVYRAVLVSLVHLVDPLSLSASDIVRTLPASLSAVSSDVAGLSARVALWSVVLASGVLVSASVAAATSAPAFALLRALSGPS